MAIQIAAIAAGAAAAAGYQALGQVWQTYVSPQFTPTTYDQTLRQWHSNPILMPEPAQLISAWGKGFINNDELRRWIQEHGVLLNQNWYSRTLREGNNWYERVWQQVIKSTETAPAPDVYFRKWILSEPGYTYQGLKDVLVWNGINSTEAINEYTDSRNTPTLADALLLRNREEISDDRLQEYMKCLGYSHGQERNALKQLRYWWPGPSDIITWAVKDVWRPEIVNRFQYDAEFPVVFQQFMDRQGAGWKPSDIGFPVDAQFDITIPAAMWRAHWQVISPSQAMDAVHRLRPIAPGNPGSRTAGVPAFTRDDFELILKTADYPPIMREWLFGLSYTPLSRIDIRRFSRLLPWTRQDILERYRDLGYSEADAGVQADFTLAERHAMETGRDRARIETVIRQLYEECVYSSGEAAAALKAARLKTPAQQADFAALSTAQQQSQGLADPAISYLLNSLDAKKKLNLAKKTKSAVRSAVLRREIDLNTAQLLLSQAGITGNCATELLQLWQLEMMVKGKQATASQILRWFVRGAITGQEVALRLSAMGYSNRDITAMLAVAGQDISLAVARQRKQLATDERSRLQAIRTELRLLRQQRKEAIADLNASATKAQIVKFYSSGLVSRQEAFAALIQRGVFPRDADLFLQEIDDAKDKVSNKVNQGPSQNGQTSKSGDSGTTEGDSQL